MYAGEKLNIATPFMVLAALAGFLIRQPLTILVKSLSVRRSCSDLPPAILWSIIYALLGIIALVILGIQGFGFILILALPAIQVFAWHLWLVSRRAERRQVGVEILGSGVLALADPADTWVGMGSAEPTGWILWGLTWLQSAATIVYAYLRLQQRVLPAVPPLRKLLRMGR